MNKLRTNPLGEVLWQVLDVVFQFQSYELIHWEHRH